LKASQSFYIPLLSKLFDLDQMLSVYNFLCLNQRGSREIARFNVEVRKIAHNHRRDFLIKFSLLKGNYL
jgi:hypothetical protein